MVVIFLMIESVVASMMEFYPFGDSRTSSYLIAILLVAAATGIGSAYWVIAGRSRLVSTIACGLLASWWAVNQSWSSLGDFGPVEQLGPLVREIGQDRRQGDVVVVYYASAFAYAYYAPDEWQLSPSSANSAGFDISFDKPSVVVLPNHRQEVDKYDAEVDQIANRFEHHRVWLVMSHIYGQEDTYLTQQLGRYGQLIRRFDLTNAELVLFQLK
jgi:hypothetical protein